MVRHLGHIGRTGVVVLGRMGGRVDFGFVEAVGPIEARRCCRCHCRCCLGSLLRSSMRHEMEARIAKARPEVVLVQRTWLNGQFPQPSPNR